MLLPCHRGLYRTAERACRYSSRICCARMALRAYCSQAERHKRKLTFSAVATFSNSSTRAYSCRILVEVSRQLARNLARLARLEHRFQRTPTLLHVGHDFSEPIVEQVALAFRRLQVEPVLLQQADHVGPLSATPFQVFAHGSEAPDDLFRQPRLGLRFRPARSFELFIRSRRLLHKLWPGRASNLCRVTRSINHGVLVRVCAQQRAFCFRIYESRTVPLTPEQS
jgi:hypothetical protein